MSQMKYERPCVMATIFSEMKKYHVPVVAAACSGPASGSPAKKRVDVAEGLGVEVVLAGEELGAQRVAAHGRAVARREVELLAGVGLVVGLDARGPAPPPACSSKNSCSHSSRLSMRQNVMESTSLVPLIQPSNACSTSVWSK